MKQEYFLTQDEKAVFDGEDNMERKENLSSGAKGDNIYGEYVLHLAYQKCLLSVLQINVMMMMCTERSCWCFYH